MPCPCMYLGALDPMPAEQSAPIQVFVQAHRALFFQCCQQVSCRFCKIFVLYAGPSTAGSIQQQIYSPAGSNCCGCCGYVWAVAVQQPRYKVRRAAKRVEEGSCRGQGACERCKSIHEWIGSQLVSHFVRVFMRTGFHEDSFMKSMSTTLECN